MNAPGLILTAWMAFAGTHLVLGMPPLRTTLVARFGESQFVALFSGIAGLSLGVLALAVAMVGGDGPAGPALGRMPLMRGLLAAGAFFGLGLAIAGLLNYMRSPMALFRTRLNPPSTVEKVTRHPFFVGLALFAGAHAMLATTLASCVHFLGFAALATAGALLQDGKLLARHGVGYAEHMAVTSVFPFAAVIGRRQTFAAAELWQRRFLITLAITLVLLLTHAAWTSFHGAPLTALMAIGGVTVSARRWLHAG